MVGGDSDMRQRVVRITLGVWNLPPHLREVAQGRDPVVPPFQPGPLAGMAVLIDVWLPPVVDQADLPDP